MMDDTIALDSIQAIAASFGSSFDAEKILDTVVEKDGTRYYKVRWVKYSWEPSASFTHLEHLIADFWEQLTQNNEDILDIQCKLDPPKKPLPQQIRQQDQSNEQEQRLHLHQQIPHQLPLLQKVQHKQVHWEKNQLLQVGKELEQHPLQQQQQQQTDEQQHPQPCRQEQTEHQVQPQQPQATGNERQEQHLNQEPQKHQQKEFCHQKTLQVGQQELQQNQQQQQIDQQPWQNQEPQEQQQRQQQHDPLHQEDLSQLHELLHPKSLTNADSVNSSEVLDGKVSGNHAAHAQIAKILQSSSLHETKIGSIAPCVTKTGTFSEVDGSIDPDKAIPPTVKPKTRRKIPGNCPICGKYFKSTTNIAAHRKLHTEERKHTCDKCGQKFRRKLHLERHLESHSNVKGFSCSVCGKSFSSKWYMLAHARIHSGEKPFGCDLCDKTFADKANLNKHKLIHLNTKPYVCNECGRAYRQSYDLKRHMAVHSSNKNFICDICGKLFARKSYLQRHMVTHSHTTTSIDLPRHLNETQDDAISDHQNRSKPDPIGEVNCDAPKDISCRFCPSTFAEQKKLSEHMEMKHRNESSSIELPAQIQRDEFVVLEHSGLVHTEASNTLREIRQPNETSGFIGPDGRPIIFLTLQNVNDSGSLNSTVPSVDMPVVNEFQFTQ